MNSFTITVTEAHLQKAIEAAKTSVHCGLSHRCTVAQALMEVPGLKFESIAFTSVATGDGRFDCPEADKITNHAYDYVVLSEPERISALLPLTLTFTRRN